MAKDGLKPDNYTCSTLVKGVIPDQAYWQMFSRIGHRWKQQDKFVCQQNQDADRAFQLLFQMQTHPEQFRDAPDEVLFNCMLDMCVRFRDLNAALFLF